MKLMGKYGKHVRNELSEIKVRTKVRDKSKQACFNK